MSRLWAYMLPPSSEASTICPSPLASRWRQRHQRTEGEHHAGLHLARSGVDRRLARLHQGRHHAGARGGEFVEGGQVAVGPFGPEA